MRSEQEFGNGVLPFFLHRRRSLFWELWGIDTGKLAEKSGRWVFETDLHADPAVPGPLSKV